MRPVSSAARSALNVAVGFGLSVITYNLLIVIGLIAPDNNDIIESYFITLIFTAIAFARNYAVDYMLSKIHRRHHARVFALSVIMITLYQVAALTYLKIEGYW